MTYLSLDKKYAKHLIKHIYFDSYLYYLVNYNKSVILSITISP